jgi:hypothetical protein
MHPQHQPGAGTAPSGPGTVRELHVSAREIRPGDYLPPQRALHGTRFREIGFAVGGSDRDVAELAVLSGRMLVFGPLGTLDSLAVDTDVAVLRPVDRCCA